MRCVVVPLGTLEDTWVKLNLIGGTAKLNELSINVRINGRMYSWCNAVRCVPWLFSNSKAHCTQ